MFLTTKINISPPKNQVLTKKMFLLKKTLLSQKKQCFHQKPCFYQKLCIHQKPMFIKNMFSPKIYRFSGMASYQGSCGSCFYLGIGHKPEMRKIWGPRCKENLRKSEIKSIAKRYILLSKVCLVRGSSTEPNKVQVITAKLFE